MPLPESMSENELEEALKQDPDNEWLKEMLYKKRRLINKTVLERELNRDVLHYT